MGKGEVVFREGDGGDSMFLVEEGVITLEIEGGWRTVRCGPGTTFGELAIVLPGHRRTGTAVAECAGVLWELGRRALEGAVATEAEAAFTLIAGAAATLLESERRLVASLRRRTAELDTALRALRQVTTELDAVERQALTDPLTGLYNRRAMERHLDLLTSEPDGGGAAVLIVDLDWIKAINDTYGHVAGDQALRHLGKILGAVARSSDLPFRIGGDEFAILAVGASAKDGRRLGERLLAAVRERPAPLESGTLQLSLSIGGTVSAPDEPWQEVLKRADAALYDAKRAGRSCLRWKDPPPAGG